jgi:hypothetical protein
MWKCAEFVPVSETLLTLLGVPDSRSSARAPSDPALSRTRECQDTAPAHRSGTRCHFPACLARGQRRRSHSPFRNTRRCWCQRQNPMSQTPERHSAPTWQRRPRKNGIHRHGRWGRGIANAACCRRLNAAVAVRGNYQFRPVIAIHIRHNGIFVPGAGAMHCGKKELPPCGRRRRA